MSFGYSIGDFVTTGQLAWKIYKSCKDAPESFGHIHTEVLSLHAVLKEVHEAFSQQTLSPSRQTSLKYVGDGCRDVLAELQALVEKYHSLGINSKLTWDRMKWGAEDIVGLRARLTSNVGLLTAFLRCAQGLASGSSLIKRA